MRRFAVFALVLGGIVAYGLLPESHQTAVRAAGQNASACGDEDHGDWGGRAKACEVRSQTLTLSGTRLLVEATNGGIEVSGEDRKDVALEARVKSWAGSDSEAKDILRQVKIETAGDRIHDSGPRYHMGNKGYAVEYKLKVPRQLSVEAKSMNGGIGLAHLEGEIRFSTTNGGVELNDLAGDVRGETVNGGLDIALTGDRWKGAGLHATTTNGGVELKVPEHYAAHLEAGTVNGGIEVSFPITVQGELKNHLSTDLNGGGATIHAETTNGGVQVERATGESASL